MEIAVVFVIGLLVGMIIMDILSHRDSMGTLRVDRSDPDDGPYLFLELSNDVNHVSQKKYIVLKVDTNSYLPR